VGICGHGRTLVERATFFVSSLPTIDRQSREIIPLGHTDHTSCSPFEGCAPMMVPMNDAQGLPWSASTESADSVDVGSFTHGVCRVCGWRGPGRRSRRLAAQDAATHLGACEMAGDASFVADSRGPQL
jgi:hypothetical protein